MNIPKRFEAVKWEDVGEDIQGRVMNILDNRRGIYLWGKSGTGKTHIAYAIKKYCFEIADPKIPVIFKNVPQFLKEIKDDYGRQLSDKEYPLENIMNNRDLLIFDDLGSEKMSEWVEEVFYLLINNRYEEMIPIIFTSNYSIQELSTRLSDRIISRIVGSCDIVELQGNDRRICLPPSVSTVPIVSLNYPPEGR